LFEIECNLLLAWLLTQSPNLLPFPLKLIHLYINVVILLTLKPSIHSSVPQDTGARYDSDEEEGAASMIVNEVDEEQKGVEEGEEMEQQ